MKILGIDYGRKKIGLAVGDDVSKLAEPWKVIKFEKIEEGIKKVEQEIQVEKVEKVVVGISEGEMAKEIEKFGKVLEMNINIPIEFQDETLSTYDAKELSIQAGINRKKRKIMEDAYSAALILQSYLDTL